MGGCCDDGWYTYYGWGTADVLHHWERFPNAISQCEAIDDVIDDVVANTVMNAHSSS